MFKKVCGSCAHWTLTSYYIPKPVIAKGKCPHYAHRVTIMSTCTRWKEIPHLSPPSETSAACEDVQWDYSERAETVADLVKMVERNSL